MSVYVVDVAVQFFTLLLLISTIPRLYNSASETIRVLDQLVQHQKSDGMTSHSASRSYSVLTNDFSDVLHRFHAHLSSLDALKEELPVPPRRPLIRTGMIHKWTEVSCITAFRALGPFERGQGIWVLPGGGREVLHGKLDAIKIALRLRRCLKNALYSLRQVVMKTQPMSLDEMLSTATQSPVRDQSHESEALKAIAKKAFSIYVDSVEALLDARRRQNTLLHIYTTAQEISTISHATAKPAIYEHRAPQRDVVCSSDALDVALSSGTNDIITNNLTPPETESHRIVVSPNSTIITSVHEKRPSYSNRPDENANATRPGPNTLTGCGILDPPLEDSSSFRHAIISSTYSDFNLHSSPSKPPSNNSDATAMTSLGEAIRADLRYRFGSSKPSTNSRDDQKQKQDRNASQITIERHRDKEMHKRGTNPDDNLEPIPKSGETDYCATDRIATGAVLLRECTEFKEMILRQQSQAIILDQSTGEGL